MGDKRYCSIIRACSSCQIWDVKFACAFALVVKYPVLDESYLEPFVHFASCKVKLLIRIASLGIVVATPFNSAKARFALFTWRNMFLLSTSIFRGNTGML